MIGSFKNDQKEQFRKFCYVLCQVLSYFSDGIKSCVMIFKYLKQIIWLFSFPFVRGWRVKQFELWVELRYNCETKTGYVLIYSKLYLHDTHKTMWDVFDTKGIHLLIYRRNSINIFQRVKLLVASRGASEGVQENSLKPIQDNC